MGKWNARQKQLVAEFLSNFALAWLTFGLVAPIFTRIENVLYFVVRLIIAFVFSYFSLKMALDQIK